MNNRLQDTVTKSETSAIAASRPSTRRRARRGFLRLWRDQRGANLLEYGVLCGCVAIAGLTFVDGFGKKVDKAFERLGLQVDSIAKKK